MVAGTLLAINPRQQRGEVLLEIVRSELCCRLQACCEQPARNNDKEKFNQGVRYQYRSWPSTSERCSKVISRRKKVAPRPWICKSLKCAGVPAPQRGQGQGGLSDIGHPSVNFPAVQLRSSRVVELVPDGDDPLPSVAQAA